MPSVLGDSAIHGHAALFTDLKTTDLPCPVAVGPQTSVTTVTIGSVPLSGRLDATINWRTVDDKEILCLETILCVA